MRASVSAGRQIIALYPSCKGTKRVISAALAPQRRRLSSALRQSAYHAAGHAKIGTRGGAMQVIGRALACLVLVIGLIGPARADDRIDCRGSGAPETVIASCTRVIGAGGVQGGQLADLYVARARAYRAQADLDHAIADFDEAIRIDPARPFLLELRGNAWHAKHDYPKAIADYERALQLNPKLIPDRKSTRLNSSHIPLS